MRIVFAAALSCATLMGSAESALALPVETIIIDTQKGARKFSVEVAADQPAQARGLMFRKEMDADAGMIFPFDPPQFVAFWMKNTFIPLDMLFVKPDGTISTITANAEPLSEKSIPSVEPVRAVIELNGGRAAALGIAPGDRVHALEFHNSLLEP